MASTQNIILFGGTFDPVHTGHIQVAEHSLHSLNADALFFIPAFRSPHKQHMPIEGHHRITMIRKAIGEHEGLSVDDCEIRRKNTSYTLDTIHYFRDRFGQDAVLFWLIGADQLSDFERWHRVNELLEACRVSVMIRAGYPRPDFSRFEAIFSNDRIDQLKKDVVATPEIDLSSTEIRQHLLRGEVNPDVLQPSVLEYIIEHGLYGYSK